MDCEGDEIQFGYGEEHGEVMIFMKLVSGPAVTLYLPIQGHGWTDVDITHDAEGLDELSIFIQKHIDSTSKLFMPVMNAIWSIHHKVRDKLWKRIGS